MAREGLLKFRFHDSFFQLPGKDQKTLYTEMMTKELCTKIVKFMTLGAGGCNMLGHGHNNHMVIMLNFLKNPFFYANKVEKLKFDAKQCKA